MKFFDPILSCADSINFEREYFANSKISESNAMQKVAEGCAKNFIREFANVLPSKIKILVLSGKGHNGGDAILTAREIIKKFSHSCLTLCIPPQKELRPNTRKALDLLQKDCPTLTIISPEELSQTQYFDVVIEGIAAMNFCPPMRPEMEALIREANKISARVKISIDIPAGVSDTPTQIAFKADATYATAIAKTPIFKTFNREFCGRVRYVDIGFFDYVPHTNGSEFTPRQNALDFLNLPRPSVSDKRSYGHLFMICGSRTYPGAAMLNAKAALRGGLGLLTVFVPESVAAQFAAIEPSAIWIGCPEDENGAIALESLGMIRARLKSATSILAGSGITQSAETRVLISEILKLTPNIPAILDADAICAELLETLSKRPAPALITPHEGEVLRVAPDASDNSLVELCKKYDISVALKSSITRISDGHNTIKNLRGSPALARAGSGDLYSGLCAALMANSYVQNFLSCQNFSNKNKNTQALKSAACAAQWLGISAELASAELGECALATSDIARFIPHALLNSKL